MGVFCLKGKNMPHKYGEGIPIPDVIDPPDSMAYTLCIPKNMDHRAAFFGALYQLTMWNTWQNDGTTHGKEVAAVWMRYWLSWNRNFSEIDCEDGMAKCCTPNPELKRIDPVTERPQISYDGGVTWQASPDDTQSQITLLPPIVRSGSPSTKCDAATNAIQHINELITATGENLSTAADILSLAVAVAETALGLFLIIVSAGSLTAPVIGLATAIWAAATGVFNLGIDGYNAYWTTDKQDAIFCAIVCNIGDNGQFTEAQYQAFRAKVKAVLPASPAFDIVMTAINAGGAQGLSQMASYGSWATADCDSCACSEGCTQVWNISEPNPGDVLGVITSQDDNQILAQTTNPQGGSGYYIYMDDGGLSNCCYVTVEVLTSSSSVAFSWQLCGSSEIQSGIIGDGKCVNTLIMNSANPFSVKVTKATCPV